MSPLTYVKAVVTTVVLSVAFAAGWQAKGWIDSKRIALLKSEVSELKAAQTSLLSGVAEQNRAIERLVAEGNKLQQRLTEALAAASKVRVEYRERIKYIEREGPPPDASCEGAMKWLVDFYSAYVWLP